MSRGQKFKGKLFSIIKMGEGGEEQDKIAEMKTTPGGERGEEQSLFSESICFW